jgi:RHS repeat-associated protein
VIQDTNPGFQPFGYAGGLYDAATGLVRFGARDYDPSLGRWTAKDPVGLAGGSTNLYAYVRNRPTILRDPKGFDPDMCFEAEMCFEPEQSTETTFEGVVIFDEGAHEGIGIVLSDGTVIRFDKRCGSEGGFGGFGLACTVYGKSDIARQEYPSIQDAYADGDVVHGPVDEKVTESVYNWLENEFENQADGYYNLFNQSCQDLLDDALEQAGSDYPQGFGSWF